MNIKTFKGGYDQNFTYVLHDDNKCCILDPAVASGEVLAWVKGNNLVVEFVVFLHSHFDHIVDLDIYRKEGIPIYAYESTDIPVDKKLVDGEEIGFNEVKLKVLHTPGHRFDSICLLMDANLFTSDTLFVEGCGRIDFEGSEPEKMWATLDRLKNMPGDLVVYPGHDYGSTPTSTIEKEKKNNRFFNMSREQFMDNRL
jgi:hydroxyacylglutathione hydrolase